MRALAVWERRQLVVRLVHELNLIGSRCGSTHVQKCSFFLQAASGVPLGYNFVIYHYGPYSFGLEDDLAVLRSKGWLEAVPDPEGYGVHYQVGRAYEEAGLNVAEQYREAIRRVVRSLGTRRVRELELLATACFLYRGVDGRTRDERVTVQEVLGLKPHFSAREVRAALQEVAQLESALRA